MADVKFKDVAKTYKGGVIGCTDVNLHIKDREFCVLVGPSGCGKSTTLRLVAGLEEITSGTLQIDGRTVNNVPPKDRDIAMVFQNYALYPHMKVADNLAFGLKLRKYPKDEIVSRVKEAGEILGITPLLDRRPKQLSGGQRQRVALGRAIVRKPKVFLFDEPLSNLDAKLRVQMRMEIKKLHAKLQTTMIYVTHDQVEAMTMGDRIVVMKEGLIQQTSDPLELYNNPVNKFVAGFIGSPAMNFLDAKVTDNGNSFVLEGNGFKISLVKEAFKFLQPVASEKVVIGIRPEDIMDSVYMQSTEAGSVIRAEVEAEEPMGSENYVHSKIGDRDIIMKTKASNRVNPGDEMDIVFNFDGLHFFRSGTGEKING